MRTMSPLSSNWLTACLLGLLLSACSSTPTSRVENAEQTSAAPIPMPADYAKALQLMQAGDYQAALPVLLDFIDKNETLAGPYVNLGIVYQRTEQHEAAMTALKRAIELNPDNAVAHHQLGILYREQGEFESARGAYQTAIELDADYALAHRNIGILYDLYLGQATLALEHYQKYRELAVEPDPNVDRWLVDLQRRSGSTQARSEQ